MIRNRVTGSMVLLAFVTALLAGGFFSGIAQGQQAAPKGYLPGLGDLMNASMQVHHVKLWFAVQTGQNWPLAAYEVKELHETLDDIQTFSPTWHNQPVGKMAPAMLGSALDAVDTAIKHKNVTQFTAAYDTLSNSCTSCHTALGFAYIKITRPNARVEYPDQPFK